MQETGQEPGQETGQKAESHAPEINEENLSVFEDFLENIDIDDEDKGEQGDDGEKKNPS
jgi:hypothetical protein